MVLHYHHVHRNWAHEGVDMYGIGLRIDLVKKDRSFRSKKKEQLVLSLRVLIWHDLRHRGNNVFYISLSKCNSLRTLVKICCVYIVSCGIYAFCLSAQSKSIILG